MACPIPPMTDPRGTIWRQPGLSLLDFDTVPGRVILPKVAFNLLADYSTTFPSGVYPGKMWRRRADTGWLLCWFDEAPGHPDKRSIHHRPIMLLEMVDLIGGPNVQR